MNYIDKEKSIKADIAGIENRVRHAFNQGYDFGFKDGKERVKSLNQESILDKIIAEIKEWYWQADKQALAKDPCVVDAMIDLFIRTIDKYKAEGEDN